MTAFLVLAAITFILHLVWERSHIVLYTGYEKMEGRLPVYLWASLGDVMYTFVALGIASFFTTESLWFLNATPTNYMGLALLGFFIAVFVEYKAMALGRWHYTARMPRFLGLGLSPLLQMTVLLPLSVYITAAIL